MRKHKEKHVAELKKGDVLITTDNRRWTVQDVRQSGSLYQVRAVCGKNRETFKISPNGHIRIE